MWRPWWRHLGYVLQVWRHLGVQIWCAVIRHLGSISEVFEHGWVAHLSASDPPPPRETYMYTDSIESHI